MWNEDKHSLEINICIVCLTCLRLVLTIHFRLTINFPLKADYNLEDYSNNIIANLGPGL